MALTRITKGVIKPNENYDTHNINSTGIITAVGANFTGDVSVGGILTYEDVTSIDSVGIITARQGIHVGAGISVVGVGTFGSLDIGGDIDVDGHTNLDNVSVAGVTTFSGNVNITNTNPKLFFYDTNNDSDYAIVNNGGVFRINDETNSLNRFSIDSNGNVSILKDLDVDGHTNLDNVSIVGVTTITGTLLDLNSSSANPAIFKLRTNVNTCEIEGRVSGGENHLVLSSNNSTDHLKITGSTVQLPNDNQRLEIGANQELKIAQDGTHNITYMQNVGPLQLQTDDLRLYNYSTQDLYLRALTNAGVSLYYDYSNHSTAKLATTATGVTIDGTAVATGADINGDLDVDGHTNLDNISVAGVSTFSGVVRVPNGSAAAPAIHFGDSDSGVYGDSSNGVRLTAGGSDTIVATTNGVTLPSSVRALTSLTLGSQSALSKPLYFADAASVQSASILLDNSSQELRIKNGRFSGAITFTTYNTEKLLIESSGRITGKEPGTGHGMGGIIASTANAGGNAGFGFMTAGTQRFNITTIGSAGSESLRVYDNNDSTERLRITSGGALRFSNTESLIHTSADTSRLRLFGGSTNNTSNGAALALHGVNHSSGNYAVLAAATGGFLRFSIGTAEKLRITSAGTVNIGGNYTNTANTFYINSSVGDAAKIVSGGGDTLSLESTVASSRSTLKFLTNGNDWEIGARGSAGNPDNHFYLYDNAVNEYRVVVNPSGFVGIGTANPTDILDINSDSASAVTNMYLRNHANLGGAALNIWTQGSYNSPTYKAIIGCSDSGGNIRMGAHSNHDLLLLTNNDPKVTIKTDGSVVIRHNGATASDGHAGLEVRSTSDKYQIVASSSSTASNSNYSTLGFKLHPSGQNERIKAAIQCQGNGGGYGEVSRMMFCLDSVGDNGNAQGNSADEKLRIESSGDIIFKNNGGDNRIERNTTSGGPYLLFHNRGINTTDSSGVYNLGGISAAGYRDVANPGIVGSMQFVRQPTAGGASSGCDIIFRTGFNGTTSHTAMSERMRISYTGAISSAVTRQALSYTALATPTTYTHSATGNTNVTINVNSTFGVPSNAKAILVQGWYNVSGYSQGNAGQADHATCHYSERSHSGSHPWSFYHDTSSQWGQYVMDHDGDASGSPHHYGMWGGQGVINVNPNGNIYGALYWGYSGGTHYNQLWCFGYYM